MMAGNRHAGAFVIAFAVALLCLSLLAVIRTHWKTRQPVPQKSITGSLSPPHVWNGGQLLFPSELQSRDVHCHHATREPAVPTSFSAVHGLRCSAGLAARVRILVGEGRPSDL